MYMKYIYFKYVIAAGRDSVAQGNRKNKGERIRCRHTSNVNERSNTWGGLLSPALHGQAMQHKQNNQPT